MGLWKMIKEISGMAPTVCIDMMEMALLTSEVRISDGNPGQA